MIYYYARKVNEIKWLKVGIYPGKTETLNESFKTDTPVDHKVVLDLDKRSFWDPELFVDKLNDFFSLFAAVRMNIRIKKNHPNDCHQLLEIIHPEIDLAFLGKNLFPFVKAIFSKFTAALLKILGIVLPEKFADEMIINPARSVRQMTFRGHQNCMNDSRRR